MASSSSTEVVGPETEIAIKIQAQGLTRKLKLPFKHLIPAVLPHKLRAFLGLHPQQVVVFERYSDSSATYVNLDATNVQAYKTLARAARAKRRLRLRAHIGPLPNPPQVQNPLVKPYLVDVPHPQNGQGASLAPHLPMHAAVTHVSASSPVQHVHLPSSDLMQHKKDMLEIMTGESVATAITDFCEGQANAAAQQAEPGRSVEEKNTAFVKRIREMDELIRMRIMAHKAQQVADLASAGAAKSTVKPETIKQEDKSLGPVFSFTNPPKLPAGATLSWSVYCNHCNKNMLEEHFHCNSCENGNFDLCTDCMAQGKHCLDEGHWIIKRYLRDGKVINGETHKVVQSPKPRSSALVNMPGSFDVVVEKKAEELKKPTRTCNCCITVLDEDAFVNCKDCKDYDLCQKCLYSGEHGHHPAHTFVPATKETLLSAHAQALCKPGRNATHTALCDECDDRIVGVRYKCLVCPDWDYCSKCSEKSSLTHRGHRFAPIYESIVSQSFEWAPSHAGVYCDGPLCQDKKSYIAGVRYKCAVCDDLDFCAGCEALPNSTHNKTHPLIKFRTPVRGCSISTLVDNEPFRSASQDHASKTQICTVAEVKPTECSTQTKDKASIKDITTQTSDEKVLVQEVADEKDLHAHFVRDTISDGTIVSPSHQFIQVWTLRNPGPAAWPAGCSVHFVGGDNMLNILDEYPSSDADYARAIESNVLRRVVEVGDEVMFRVTMKAPQREGTAISYWRLKTPSGTPFGHRLWCHVSVGRQQQPEVGRLGSHDAYLRHNLNEQFKNEHKDKCLTGHPAADLRDIIERLETLRTGAEPHASQDESVAESSKSQKVKIEVIEADAAPKENSKQTLSFPTLDVSSSVSSAAAEAVTTNAAAVESVPAIALAQTAATTPHEAAIFDDAESITVAESIDLSDDDDSSDEDGFMTEDEYDILDASDHEIV